MMIAIAEILIDPEFEEKIPKLTDEEYELLEQNILTDGMVINPLILWNRTLIDGHNRYHILEKHPELPYSVHEKEFADRYEAIAYICKNQLGRRNLTPEQKKYLIGKQYEAEKCSASDTVRGMKRDEQGLFIGGYQNDNYRAQEKTCERIARENSIGPATVLRAEKYANGVDAAEEVSPGIRQEILSGALKATDKEITAIGRAGPEERKELTRRLREPDPPKGATVSNELEADEEEDTFQPVTNASLKDIQMISDSLLHSEGIAAATEDDMIYEMEDALENLIWRWNNCREIYPVHVKSGTGKERIRKLADDGMEFLKQVKKGTLWK